MIVSHQNQFIFLKTKKTAGTAVELALAPHCGANDIITPTDPNEEVDNARQGHLPRNYMRAGPSTWLPRLHAGVFRRQKLDKTNYYHHMPADLVRKRIGSKVWNSYFKFTIERNPWERQISYFYYMKTIHQQKLNGVDFSTFLQSRSGNINNTRIYLCDDVVSVDSFIRFERLNEDLADLGKLLGLKFQVLQSINVTTTKDKRPYQEFYSRSDREYIEKLYWREIELFGYDFETGISTKSPQFGMRLAGSSRVSGF